MEISWHTGWYVLAYAILAPVYCCPEKAFCEYLNVGSRRKTRTVDWFTPELLEEMQQQRNLLGNKKASELYGIEPSNFCHILKRHKSNCPKNKHWAVM